MLIIEAELYKIRLYNNLKNPHLEQIKDVLNKTYSVNGVSLHLMDSISISSSIIYMLKEFSRDTSLNLYINDKGLYELMNSLVPFNKTDHNIRIFKSNTENRKNLTKKGRN